MWKPRMNCEWDYPEWEFESQPWGVTIKEKPEICEECDFFRICFMNRTARILWLPINLSVDDMTRIVNLQRLQESWADDEVIWTYVNYISNTQTK